MVDFFSSNLDLQHDVSHYRGFSNFGAVGGGGATTLHQYR